MSRSIKVLVAKLGLDGHDRGALVLCRAFRDAGMEVIYSGLFATPERVAQMAEDEDVDAVAMSLLNGAHNTLFPRVVTKMKEKNLDDVLVVGGGVIPPSRPRGPDRVRRQRRLWTRHAAVQHHRAHREGACQT